MRLLLALVYGFRGENQHFWKLRGTGVLFSGEGGGGGGGGESKQKA